MSRGRLKPNYYRASCMVTAGDSANDMVEWATHRDWSSLSASSRACGNGCLADCSLALSAISLLCFKRAVPFSGGGFPERGLACLAQGSLFGAHFQYLIYFTRGNRLGFGHCLGLGEEAPTVPDWSDHLHFWTINSSLC